MSNLIYTNLEIQEYLKNKDITPTQAKQISNLEQGWKNSAKILKKANQPNSVLCVQKLKTHKNSVSSEMW